MAYLLHKPLAVCSNDAKFCYDRIVHSVASLALQRTGMPLGPAISIFNTIQNTNHIIRTAFSNSWSSFNRKDLDKPY